MLNKFKVGDTVCYLNGGKTETGKLILIFFDEEMQETCCRVATRSGKFMHSFCRMQDLFSPDDSKRQESNYKDRYDDYVTNKR